MADLQAGVGPFLGIFLLAHGWKSGLIGSVMTIGGVAGMVMTIPAGALIDATKADEIIITSDTFEHSDRLRSYELIAQAKNL